MRRNPKIATLVAVVALVAAACGGASAPEGATTQAPSQTTAPSGGGGGGDVANGEKLFQGTCAACHGADAKGIQGLGKPLANSQFVQGLSDDDLVAFIKAGRPASDPENTTGVGMPPKGGNPSLSDDDLLDIVAFLRTLQ